MKILAKRIFKLILITIISIFAFNKNVSATISGNVSPGSGNSSTPCTTGICIGTAKMINDTVAGSNSSVDGIRVELYNGTTRVGISKNLWFSTSKQNFVKGIDPANAQNQDNIETLLKRNAAYIKYKDDISPRIFDYYNFITKIGQNNDEKAVDILLKKINSNYKIENFTDSKYYLVIEPIVVMQFVNSGRGFSSYGTPDEIYLEFLSEARRSTTNQYAAMLANCYSSRTRHNTVNDIYNYFSTFEIADVSRYPKFSNNAIPEYYKKCNSGWTYANKYAKGGNIGWMSDNYNTTKYGKGIIQISAVVPQAGSIKITKTNSVSGKTITSAPATFSLYSNGNCSGTPKTTNLKTSNGILTISGLSAGTYSLRETAAPNGYISPASDNCIQNITVTVGRTVSRTVTNGPTCATELSDLGAGRTKAQLVNLWKKYPNNTNLLNFSNPSCSPATNCFDPTCPTGTNCPEGPNNSCLNAAYSPAFNENNWSCYTSTVDVGGKTGFCASTFKLSPSSSYKPSLVKAGQLYFNVENGVLLQGSFGQQCYFAEDVTGEIPSTKRISDYLVGVKLSRNEENCQEDCEYNLNMQDDSIIKLNRNSGTSFSFDSNVNYLIDEVYVENVSGKPSISSCDTCKLLGYGILSKLNTGGTNSFTFSMKLDLEGSKNDKNFSSICTYNSDLEVVKNDDLQLEFRNVQVYNPFPGKSGKTRTPGYNWRIDSLDINGDSIFDSTDYDLIKSLIHSNLDYLDKYDINKDGKTDDRDLEILNKYLINGEDLYAKTVLENTVNSYGIIPSTGRSSSPKYVIRLTSKDILDIRRDNKSKPYDDYDLTCVNDGKICISNYLDVLRSRGVLTINNTLKRELYNKYK